MKRSQLGIWKYERKNLIGKGKYTVKVGHQSLVKVEGRLKDKIGKVSISTIKS